MKCKTTTFGLILIFVAVSAIAAGRSEEQAQSEPAAEDSKSTEAAPVTKPVTYDPSFMKDQLRPLGLRVMDEQVEAPAFDTNTLAGGTASLSDYRGKLVFLNFWATWCPPCREEMPSMEQLKAETAGRPFAMVAVNVQEDPQTVQGFVDELGYTFEILLDQNGGVAGRYGVRGLPTTFFVGPDGNVLGYLVGTRYWDEEDVLSAVDSMLSHLEQQ